MSEANEGVRLEDLAGIAIHPADEGFPEAYVDSDGGRLSALAPLGRVNLFVGATNSGKSRLLRWLAARQTLHAQPRWWGLTGRPRILVERCCSFLNQEGIDAEARPATDHRDLGCRLYGFIADRNGLPHFPRALTTLADAP